MNCYNENSIDCIDDVSPGTSASSSSSSTNNNVSSRLKENEIMQKKSIKSHEHKLIINNNSNCNINESTESENEKKPLLEKSKSNHQQISIIKCAAINSQRNINLLYLVLLFICYILIGGFGFEMFELTEEQKTRKDLQNLRSTFLIKYPNVNGMYISYINFKSLFDWLINIYAYLSFKEIGLILKNI